MLVGVGDVAVEDLVVFFGEADVVGGGDAADKAQIAGADEGGGVDDNVVLSGEAAADGAVGAGAFGLDGVDGVDVGVLVEQAAVGLGADNADADVGGGFFDFAEDEGADDVVADFAVLAQEEDGFDMLGRKGCFRRPRRAVEQGFADADAQLLQGFFEGFEEGFRGHGLRVFRLLFWGFQTAFFAFQTAFCFFR